MYLNGAPNVKNGSQADSYTIKICAAKNFFVTLRRRPSAEPGHGLGAGSGHIDQRLLDACS